MIYAIESLEHATDLGRCLRHWARAMAPGGVMVVVTDLRSDLSATRQTDGIPDKCTFSCPDCTANRGSHVFPN